MLSPEHALVNMSEPDLLLNRQMLAGEVAEMTVHFLYLQWSRMSRFRKFVGLSTLVVYTIGSLLRSLANIVAEDADLNGVWPCTSKILGDKSSISCTTYLKIHVTAKGECARLVYPEPVIGFSTLGSSGSSMGSPSSRILSVYQSFAFFPVFCSYSATLIGRSATAVARSACRLAG